MRGKEAILEEYLVAGARLGDEDAARKLVALRGPRMLSHAWRLVGNGEDARDVVQDAWVEILRGLPALRDDRAFAAWAYRIVTRRAARTVTQKARRRRMEHDAALEADDTADAAGPAAADAVAVRKAIKALPPDHAAAIALFYLEDMSVAEVAVALDIPPGTVKTRLMHARSKLNEALKGGDDEQA